MSEIVIQPIKPPYPFEAYAHIIEPLAVDEGGGFLITLPDLPGCLADGATEAEAIENGRDAFLCWVSAAAEMGERIPAPKFKTVTAVGTAEPSGKFVQVVRHPLGIEQRILGDIIVNMAKLRYGVRCPLYHDWISCNTCSTGVVLPFSASSCPRRIFSST